MCANMFSRHRRVAHLCARSGSWLGGGAAPNLSHICAALLTPHAAALTLAGEDGIKQLFARGTHRRFGYGTLATLGGLYAVSAAVVSGGPLLSHYCFGRLLTGKRVGRMGRLCVPSALVRGWLLDWVVG